MLTANTCCVCWGPTGVGVECVPSANGLFETYTLKRGEVIDAQPFTAKVRRRILMRLSIKFDIPFEFFFPSSAENLPMNDLT